MTFELRRESNANFYVSKFGYHQTTHRVPPVERHCFRSTSSLHSQGRSNSLNAKADSSIKRRYAGTKLYGDIAKGNNLQN